MDIKRTPAWKAAEWDYCEIQANMRMPAFDRVMTSDDVVGCLRRIVRRCPQFYPALIELGLRLLATEGDVRSEQLIEKGFALMLELAGPKDFGVGIEGLVENLENLWRFDLSRCFLELLAGRRCINAALHDFLAHAAARLGDLTAAQSHIGDALQLEPRNKNFWSNKGWYHMMGGELEQAEIALGRARKLAPKDPVVTGNITVLKYLKRQGGNYFDYLLRPLDRKQIDRYADQERWDRVDAICVDFNEGRMEAFAQSHLLKGGKTRSRLPNMLATLKTFFRFVAQIDSSATFVHEDINRVRNHFKQIAHKFIFKFGDVDRETIGDVFDGLEAYYGFLAGQKIVAAGDFNRFRYKIHAMRDELIGKMERYNAIRHDDSMDEDQKEAIREDLFEGDHAWPHF
jgi:tetratricopeptide (TPR) repeat protein